MAPARPRPEFLLDTNCCARSDSWVRGRENHVTFWRIVFSRPFIISIEGRRKRFPRTWFVFVTLKRKIRRTPAPDLPITWV